MWILHESSLIYLSVYLFHVNDNILNIYDIIMTQKMNELPYHTHGSYKQVYKYQHPFWLCSNITCTKGALNWIHSIREGSHHLYCSHCWPDSWSSLREVGRICVHNFVRSSKYTRQLDAINTRVNRNIHHHSKLPKLAKVSGSIIGAPTTYIRDESRPKKVLLVQSKTTNVRVRQLTCLLAYTEYHNHCVLRPIETQSPGSS